VKFSEKLKELRKEQNLTQEELASKLFLSRSVIAKYESEAAKPTRENIEKIALFFNVPVSDLMGEGEVTGIVLDNDKIREKTKTIVLITSIVVSLLFIILFFIPMFKTYAYKYPIEEGDTPERVMTIKSSFQILFQNIKPYAIFVIVFALFLFIYSLLCVTIFKNKRFTYRLIAYIALIIFLFIIFFTIVFSFGYAG
jgi:transcriptional regulator with XRE-family HTH domain